MPPTIRPLVSDESHLMEALHRNAYRVDAATARRWRDNTDFTTTRAIVEGDRALSLIKILPYTILVGGKPVPMGGIGGVATWADQQGRGLASELMRYSIPEMRRLGYAISLLYPFSQRYYARFGWELASRTATYTFRQSDVHVRQSTATIRAVVSDTDWDQLKKTYAQFASRYNTMGAREERHWARKQREQSEGGLQYYFIDEASQPVGYFATLDEGPPSGLNSRVTVRDFLCGSGEAYQELAGFLSCLPTNVSEIRVIAPEVPNLWPYFGERASLEVRGGFQCRVVNIEQACALRGWSDQANSAEPLTFAIADALAPWNSGTWELRGSDEATVQIKKAEKRAEVSLTINQFSALYVGGVDPHEWLLRDEVPGLTVETARKLSSWFCDRPVHCLEWF